MRSPVTLFLAFAFVCGSLSGWTQGAAPDTIRIKLQQKEAISIFLADPDSSIKIATSTLQDTRASSSTNLRARGYYILSKAYWVKANYRLSTEFGFKALKLVENTNDRELWVSCLLSVARTLAELGNNARAEEYIHRAFHLSADLPDKHFEAEAFREHSYVMSNMKQFDSALYSSDRGIALFEKFQDTLSASILYGRKSKVYFELRNYEASRQYAYRSLLLDSLVNNRRALAISYFTAAKNEVALAHDDEAIRLLKNSVRLNNQIGNLSYLAQAHDLLATLYHKKKKSDLAFAELALASALKDSLYNREKSGQIQEMQALYELEGKENTIQLLAKENELSHEEATAQRWVTLFLLTGIALLFLLILVLWRMRQYQEKANAALAAKNDAIELQKKEIQEQAESLHQLNQLKAKLFSVISHDLRTPLANLQALLELLTNSRMTPAEFTTISDKLKIHLNASQGTLENLLNWSLSQMEGIRTDQQNVPIKSLIDEACRLMAEVADRKQVSLDLSDVEPLEVHADPNHVQLVLRNLLHNAIKFSNENTRIVISANRKFEYCEIKIRDFGMGMNQEEIDLITGTSEHFTKRGTKQEKGTGLGLLLCKEFIQRNEGRFAIESKPGDGTEVSFTLILAEN